MKQDAIWAYFQNENIDNFNASYGRLSAIGKRVPENVTVLNIGVGIGMLEELLVSKGCTVYSLDPDEQAILRLRDERGVGERAQTGYSQDILYRLTQIFSIS